jgi:hypothetical protein
VPADPVGDQRHDRRRVQLLAVEERGPDRLDLRWSQAHDRALPAATRLLDLLHGIRARHPAPADRMLEHALQHHHRHTHRMPANAGGLQVGAEVRDHLGRDLAQLVEAEPRLNVVRQQRLVAPPRPLGQVRDHVPAPPLLRQLLQPPVGLIEQPQLAELLTPLDLRREALRIPAMRERPLPLGRAMTGQVVAKLPAPIRQLRDLHATRPA